MKVVLQRVTWAEVKVDGDVVGRIGPGLLALVGLGEGDKQADLVWMARKVVHLRIFKDDAGKMNRSLLDCGGDLLAVSQFTLYADSRKGRRPSFVKALHPEQANPMFERFVTMLTEYGVNVETGRFGENMDVSLCNQGPVTIILESECFHS